MKANVRIRRFIDPFRCIDEWISVIYDHKWKSGDLWYLCGPSGYVVKTVGENDVEFID